MNVKGIVIGLASLVMLSGCAGGADYSNYALSVENANLASKDMVVAYFDKRSTDNQNIMKSLTGGNPENAANNAMSIMLYTILSQQQDEKILQQFVPMAPSKPTTNADIGMAFVNNTVPTIVKWGAGAWLGNELIDGLSQGVALGAGATYVKGSDIGGGINSPPTTTTITEAPSWGDGDGNIIEAPSIGDGDGNTVNMGSPPAETPVTPEL